MPLPKPHSKPPLLARVTHFLGLHSLHHTGLDAYLIILLRSTRLLSASIPSLTLALFFSSLHIPDPQIGLFMSLTLLGDVLLSLLLTLVADRLGRRKVLFIGSAMMVCSGAVFAVFENFWVLLVAAVVGVISVTGADCGPFRAVEESVIAGLTTQESRSDVLAWYVTFTTLAGAVGAEIAGRIVSLVENSGHNEKKAYHILFWGYAIFGAIGMGLTTLLSSKCEINAAKTAKPQPTEEDEVLLSAAERDVDDPRITRSIHPDPDQRPNRLKAAKYFSQITPPTLSIMWKLWILLAIDALADGMTPYSLMNYYVHLKFRLSKSMLGDITSASMFLCAVSAIFAGPLSKRIGLINTMVFTHLPSSLASAFIPLPRSVGWTIGLMLFRASLNSMDQAPRTAFIAAVVRPEERTAVMGITNMARTLAMAVGPSVTGLLAGKDRFWVAFLLAGICRVVYDLGLFVLFINVKLHQHEEREGSERNGMDVDMESLLGEDESSEDGKDSLDDVAKSV